MSVPKHHSFRCQLIDVRGGDFRFGIETPGISVPHIINEDNQDVRLFSRGDCYREQREN